MNEQDDSKPPIDISCKDILILVIDDDHTSLSVIGGILRSWKYNVETVRSGREALSILRSKKDKKFDLVVTDIHMPDMNGFELLRRIWEDFQVPIVMMSSDDSEKNMTKGLECGASYFMRKPVCPKDLQNLWLHVIPKRNQELSTRQDGIADTNNNTRKNHGNSTVQKIPVSSVPSTEFMSQGTWPITQYTQQRTISLVEKHQEENRRRRKISTSNQKTNVTVSIPPLNYPASVIANRKPKVAWFTGLHNKFLDALKIIGLDRAVPKKILEVMNVPGLTRENVASHLQKYRIFLKRIADVAEKSDRTNKSSKSKFASSYLSIPLGFDLENLDDADENLLRKKLKQELRAIRDPLYMSPSWRQYGTISPTDNVGNISTSFGPNKQMSVAGLVELGGTSGNITSAVNCQMITGQQSSAFVRYGMNVNNNSSTVCTGGLMSNTVPQVTDNLVNGYSTFDKDSGFQAEFSEYMIHQLTGGDRNINSPEQTGNSYLGFRDKNSRQAQMQNKNQESEHTPNEGCTLLPTQQDSSYFGEDFNPWFDQETIRTQAGDQNANTIITDELLAMCQGFRGSSAQIGSLKKSEDAS